MADRAPLSTLLSQVLVAFTIEIDNEFELRMPHRTTTQGPPPGQPHAPWLTSLVMWSNFLRVVPEDGVTVAEMERLARVPNLAKLDGMVRWRYVKVERKPGTRPRDAIVRPTAAGRKAQEIWRSLFGVMEERWETRFGQDEIASLRHSLQALIDQFDVDLPEYLPVVGYGFIQPAKPKPRSSSERQDLNLVALLSMVLLVFTLEFEQDSDLSLAMAANVVRVLNEEGVRVQDVPRLSGVSKEAIAMALSFLKARNYAVVGPDPNGSRAKVVTLTLKGQMAQSAYGQRLKLVEENWQERFGRETIHNLRESLEQLPVGKLFQGMQPHPAGWRASVRKPETLPHYPMVLHRGGYPDGS